MTPLSEKAKTHKRIMSREFTLTVDQITYGLGFDEGYHTAYTELQAELTRLKKENEELRGRDRGRWNGMKPEFMEL